MFNTAFTFDDSRLSSLDSPPLSPCTTQAFHGMTSERQYSVTDLAVCFAGSTIRQDAQIQYDPCEAYAAVDDDAGWQLEPMDEEEVASSTLYHTRMLTARACSQSRRRQRQTHTRMLCSASHHKDIAALVSRMVASEEQCSVSPPLEAVSPVGLDDEGYDSCDTTSPPASRRASDLHQQQKARLQYRRSSDLKPNSTCVSKPVRVRKDRQLRRIRTADSAS